MADVFPHPDSGAAGTEYQTIEALRRLGHDVETVWADSLPHRISHGNLHYLLELPYAYRAAMLKQMRHHLFDVIHVNQPHGYLAAKTLKAKGTRTIFVHRSHGIEPRVERELAPWRQEYRLAEIKSWGRVQASRAIGSLLRRHSQLIARYAHGHIVSASACARFLVDELRVPAEHIAVIAQAAPESYLARPAPAMAPARLGRLLYVGQYAFVKAPMIVAETFNRIAETNDSVSMTWVTAKECHGQVRELLSGAARSRVTLLDWMPQSELLEVYDGHGIFVFPSFFEGFGKAFLEAMSRGLCVVASETGGAADVITDGQDGIRVATGDAAALADACLELLESPPRAEDMSRAAAAHARLYSWDRVARQTVAFYADRLAAKDRP